MLLCHCPLVGPSCIVIDEHNAKASIIYHPPSNKVQIYSNNVYPNHQVNVVKTNRLNYLRVYISLCYPTNLISKGDPPTYIDAYENKMLVWDISM